MKRIDNYKDAVNYLGNHRVLCNNVPDIDPTIWDDLYGDWYDDDGELHEIYQYYITNCTEWDVEYLAKSFGLLFVYSEVLDCFILCVEHFGTAWDGVYCEDKRVEE